MIDPTPNECAAMREAGKAGGAYLESIQKTDLVTLTGAEWDSFIEIAITAYYDHLRELAAKDRARIDGMTPEVPF